MVRPRPRQMAGIPELTDRLPRRELTREERLVAVWAVGAHGGAGCSTIAALMAHVGDAGVAWPIAPDGEQARVLLVARESYTGLSAARRALTEWVGGRVPVALEGLLLIAAQPGGTPKELRELSELVPLAGQRRGLEAGMAAGVADRGGHDAVREHVARRTRTAVRQQIRRRRLLKGAGTE